MIAKNLSITSTLKGNPILSIELTNKTDLQALSELVGVELLEITIEKEKKKRSLSQNAYLWILCDKIASKMQSTKLEVYRQAIRQVGRFDDKDIPDELVNFCVKLWIQKGDGWVCDKMIDKPCDNHTTIRFYIGSSRYNSADMARLINIIVEDAKELGIDTMTPEEIDRLTKNKETESK